MKKCMTVLALLLCLLLTACGGKEQNSRGQTSFLGEASGLEEETILLTVDGREVPAWRYLYWLSFACSQIQQKYAESGIDLDWEMPVSGGTLEDYVKDQALADTILYETVENLAQEYGYISSGEPSGGGTLPDMGLSEERMRELEEVGQMYVWLYDLYCSGESALTPSQETLKSYAKSRGILTLDRILVPMGTDKEEARKKISEMFSRLNGAEDQAAEFSALTAEGTDTAGPRTLWPEDTGLDAALLEAARELEEGQCSGILEAQDGFSILRRLETDTAAMKEFYFDDYLLTVAEETTVNIMPEYHEINLEVFVSGWTEFGSAKERK